MLGNLGTVVYTGGCCELGRTSLRWGPFPRARNSRCRGGISTTHFVAGDRVGAAIDRPTRSAAARSGSSRSKTAGGSGGGIWANSTAVASFQSTLNHSTVTANSADAYGGGVFVGQGVLALDQSIVAANNATAGRDLTGLIGTAFDPHYSLIGSNANSGLTPAPIGSPDANGNLIGGPNNLTRINPRLGPLADNGGPTMTHALLDGSPAVNAGDPAARAGVGGVPVHDQRGAPFTRVFGGRIDIGAVESQPIDVLLGDFNSDGIVDAADYSMWRDTMGQAVVPGSGADGNGDGVVNTWDYRLWTANFGATLADLPPQPGPGSVAGALAPAEQLSSNTPPAPLAAIRRPASRAPMAMIDAALAVEPIHTQVESAGALRITRRLPLDVATRADRLLDASLADRRDRRRSINELPAQVDSSDDSGDTVDVAFAELGTGIASLRRGFASASRTDL